MYKIAVLILAQQVKRNQFSRSTSNVRNEGKYFVIYFEKTAKQYTNAANSQQIVFKTLNMQ
jgi:hypothetical protein